MTLIELLQHAAEWADDDTTIYAAQPWHCGCEAILVSPSPDTVAPIERDGARFDYFLETFIAREVLEDFAAAAEGVGASPEQRCERLIAYAVNDA